VRPGEPAIRKRRAAVRRFRIAGSPGLTAPGSLGLTASDTHRLTAPGPAGDDAAASHDHDDDAPVAVGRGPFTIPSRAGTVTARARPARARPC